MGPFVTVSIKSAVQAALLRMLEPLIRMMLSAGLGIGDFMSVVKVAYVRGARDQGRNLRGEGRPHVSRIAVVTGLTRAEVTAILNSEDKDERRTSERGRHRAERVLSGWWNDRDFHDSDGQPIPLPLSGGRRSFKTLTARYSNEPRPAPILDELLRVGAVKKRADGTYQAVSRTYATVRWNADGLEAFGEQLREHGATLLHNLENPGRPRFVRRVVNVQLDPRYLPILLRDIDQQLETMADTIDDAVNARSRTLTPGAEPQDAVKLSVAMYIYEEPVVLEPDSSSAKTRVRRRGAGS